LESLTEEITSLVKLSLSEALTAPTASKEISITESINVYFFINYSSALFEKNLAGEVTL
jgi:hypothetical protein